MYIPLSTSDGWHRGIYGSINLKKFMKPSFDQPKNISKDQTRNPKKKKLHQANLHTIPKWFSTTGGWRSSSTTLFLSKCSPRPGLSCLTLFYCQTISFHFINILNVFALDVQDCICCNSVEISFLMMNKPKYVARIF